MDALCGDNLQLRGFCQTIVFEGLDSALGVNCSALYRDDLTLLGPVPYSILRGKTASKWNLAEGHLPCL